MKNKIANTDLTQADISWLENGGPFPKTITVESKQGGKLHFQIEGRDIDGRISDVSKRKGKKGFVLFIRDESDTPYAAKLCLMNDYESDEALAAEPRLANQLRGAGALFATPIFAGKVERFPGQANDASHWACFVMERVEGNTIRDWVHNNPDQVTPDLICDIAKELITATIFLMSKKLKHDDLHWGNLMLRPADPDLIRGRHDLRPFSLTVIDTGSLKPLSQETTKPHDDWARVAKVLIQLHNVVFKNRVVASRHPRFLKSLQEFCSQLLEPDKSRVFPTENNYFEAIEKMVLDLRFPTIVETPKFQPFDAISAEHLANDKLLLDLFVNALPWIDDLRTTRPTVLSGPRGCGKSMVMRYLGAKTHLASSDSDTSFLDDIPFVGVYVSCASDLQSDVLWLARDEEKAISKSEKISTLFSLLLARELFRLFDRLLHVQSASDRLGLTLNHVADLIAFSREYLPQHTPSPRLRVSNIAGDFADELDDLRRQISRRLPFDDKNEIILPQSFIRDLVNRISGNVLGFSSRPIVFLLDDYTSHRIPKIVQNILNPIVFSRQASHLFKISCEKFGFSPDSVEGLRIDQDREYEFTDAGAYVMSIASKKQKREFIVSLLDRRLKTAGYIGQASTLIGESEFKHDTDLAKQIRTFSKGKSHHYNGLDVLANVWSGDIATILHMVRSMFLRASIKPSTRERIPNVDQHEAINSVSQGLRAQVQHYYPYGPEMYRILTEFGQMSADLLVEGIPDDTDANNVPQRKYRLEMTKDEVYELIEHIGRIESDEVSKLAKELLRRAVFVDLGPSRGKESKSSETVRWEIRSSLLPSFGLSLTRHHYIDIKSIDEFILLLKEPEKFRKTMFARYSTKNKSLELFVKNGIKND